MVNGDLTRYPEWDVPEGQEQVNQGLRRGQDTVSRVGVPQYECHHPSSEWARGWGLTGEIAYDEGMTPLKWL